MTQNKLNLPSNFQIPFTWTTKTTFIKKKTIKLFLLVDNNGESTRVSIPDYVIVVNNKRVVSPHYKDFFLKKIKALLTPIDIENQYLEVMIMRNGDFVNTNGKSVKLNPLSPFHKDYIKNTISIDL